tara:strand:- start:34415 stop:34681 length:267 start_codon:yes stop_codon:yes gene_type:complete
MLILSLNLACFPHRKVRDSLCVYFIFNQKKCDMIKKDKQTLTQQPFGFMFNPFGVACRKPDPDDDPTDPTDPTTDPDEDPPVHPPTQN